MRVARPVLLLLAVLAASGGSASGQVSLVGDWSGRYHEDQPDRVPGIEPNDYSGLPVNEAARMFADSWDVERTTVLEHQCQPYTMPYLFHGPLQFRVWEERQPDTQEFLAIKFYIGTYQQWRTIWMDGRPHPPEYAPHTFMGFSTGEWNGDILTVTDHAHQGGLLPPQRHPQQRSHDARGAFHPPRQRAVARDHRHRPGVPDRALHPQPGIRADGTQQHELALQLRVRQRGSAAPPPGADVPARQEPVADGGGRQVRHAAGGRARRRGDHAPGIRRGHSLREGDARRGCAGARRAHAGGVDAGRRGRPPCPRASCAPSTCKATST